MNRGAITTWHGAGNGGGGTMTCDSGALVNVPYTSKSRFEQEDAPTGANPEELLAAAHAASFTMALAQRLTAAGHSASSIRTEARVQVVKPTGAGGHWTIPSVRLHVSATVPGMTAQELMRHAAEARSMCPITHAMKADVSLTATLS